jgi:hypothetical protein
MAGTPAALRAIRHLRKDGNNEARATDAAVNRPSPVLNLRQRMRGVWTRASGVLNVRRRRHVPMDRPQDGNPNAISRGKFGGTGVDRILSLLDRYRSQATWFVPGDTLETYPDICHHTHADGHELGNHGYLHEPPATLSREQEEAVLVRGNEAICRITGSEDRRYHSPSRDLSPLPSTCSSNTTSSTIVA